jgi:hypothetical protein
MDIIVPTLALDQDALKLAFKERGRVFVREARPLLNQQGDGLPHTETGYLACHLKWTVRQKGSALFLLARADARYATALFAGSVRHGHQVKARPLFDVTLGRCEAKFRSIIARFC